MAGRRGPNKHNPNVKGEKMTKRMVSAHWKKRLSEYRSKKKKKR